jgi:hypothetical protein
MANLGVTLNPDDRYGSPSLSNGNLSCTTTSAQRAIRATHGKSYGKWYWEVNFDSGARAAYIGISNKNYPLSENHYNTNIRIYYSENGNKYPEGESYGTAWVAGDIIGVALDLDSGTLEFYKNGVSMGISHTNVKELGEVYPLLRSGANSTMVVTFNFGATPFKYPIPTGFKMYDYTYDHKILISSGDEYYSVIPEVMATETAVPQMTSNTTPSGRVFASSINSATYDAWKAFDRANNPFATANGSGGVGYLGYEFANPIKIGKYAIMSTAGSSFQPMPKDWTFEGSNDETNWDVLDTQINQSWTTVSTDKEYVIDTSNANRYKMYRLNWTANNNSSQTYINELKMYELKSIPNLINLPNQSEQTFINHGMNKDTSIDLTTSKILERRYIVQDNSQLVSGKVFKQKIDTTKIPIKNAMIE